MEVAVGVHILEWREAEWERLDMHTTKDTPSFLQLIFVSLWQMNYPHFYES